MAILLSQNIAQCDDRAARRPRGATTARRSVGLGLVEILSWMRHCTTGTSTLYTGIIRRANKYGNIFERPTDGNVCRNPPPDDYATIATEYAREKMFLQNPVTSDDHQATSFFNKIAIQGAPQMALDKEAISLSIESTHTILNVTCHFFMCNLP